MHGGVQPGEQWPAGDRPVEDEVDVDDRGGPQLDQPILMRHGPGWEQSTRRVVGDSNDHPVSSNAPLRGLDRKATLAGPAGPDRQDRGPEADLHPGLGEGGAGPRPVQLTERHPAPPDVRGPSVAQQPGLEHLRRHGQRRLRGGKVDGRHRDQIPQAGHRGGGLAVTGQPGPEALAVEGRVVEVEAPQRHYRPPEPEAGRQREVRVAQEGTQEVERRRQVGTAQPANTRETSGPGCGRHYRYVEPIGEFHVGRGADAVEEGEVRVAAAQEHMLAVVHPAPGVLKGPGEAAETGAPLEEGYPGAGIRAVERGSQPGQAAPDHRHMGGMVHAAPLARARTATAAFSGPGNDIRPRRTPAGSRWIRPSRRR